MLWCNSELGCTFEIWGMVQLPAYLRRRPHVCSVFWWLFAVLFVPWQWCVEIVCCFQGCNLTRLHLACRGFHPNGQTIPVTPKAAQSFSFHSAKRRDWHCTNLLQEESWGHLLAQNLWSITKWRYTNEWWVVLNLNNTFCWNWHVWKSLSTKILALLIGRACVQAFH